MASRLIEPTLLFDFSIQLHSVVRSLTAEKKSPRAKNKPNPNSSVGANAPLLWDLGESHKIPHFASLAGHPSKANVWAGWASDGMYFKMQITGKAGPPRFFGNTGGVSDGLRVWIDTRSSPGIHRATRFCHCFHFFPGQPDGGLTTPGPMALATGSLAIKSVPILPEAIAHGSGTPEATRQPRGVLDSIPRARENPAAIDARELSVGSRFEKDGYFLWSRIPSSCLTGYAPDEFDAISLFIEVVDFELGTQSISLGPELRYVEDPSLWIRAELIH
jgi:hypothetical protein